MEVVAILAAAMVEEFATCFHLTGGVLRRKAVVVGPLIGRGARRAKNSDEDWRTEYGVRVSCRPAGSTADMPAASIKQLEGWTIISDKILRPNNGHIFH